VPAKRSILIVEDDETLREMLAEQLADNHGFAVTTVGTLDAADRAINTDEGSCYDTVILDLGMPDGDGRHFCAKLRRQGHKMPIIMLTGSNSEADVVHGLDSGANDYVAKPFRTNELVARLHAQLREFENSENATFAVGPYVFHPAKRLLSDSTNQRRIRLTEKEAAILRFLYRSDFQPVDRQMLLHEVWRYNSGATTHTLETHIYRLRQKIEPNPANPTLVLTVGSGYCLKPDTVAAREV
jgi:DNA-binding response OmpR family regulator